MLQACNAELRFNKSTAGRSLDPTASIVLGARPSHILLVCVPTSIALIDSSLFLPTTTSGVIRCLLPRVSFRSQIAIRGPPVHAIYPSLASKMPSISVVIYRTGGGVLAPARVFVARRFLPRLTADLRMGVLSSRGWPGSGCGGKGLGK